MLVLLEYNNIKIEYSQEELVKLGVAIASGEFKQNDIIKWINEHKK